jgi:CMP-N-acetylneuraminic acid synthetase
MFKKLELIKRPDELCKDGSPANAYIDHLLEVRDYQASIDFRSICLLQPTCPLRNYIDINNAIEIYKRGSLPGLVSAFRVAKGLMYKDNLTSLYGTEFDRNDILYVRNSSIYIFDLQYYIVNASIFASPSHIYEMDMFKSLDINTMADLNVCQKLL